ncbi:hypothetical protein DXG01_001773, partial [Tephrocybe rancida]
MAEQPSKRARVTHKRVVLNSDIDFTTVISRDEHVVQPALVTCDVYHDGDASWITCSTWENPRDDAEYGLDPDGGWYDEAVDSE